MRRLLALAVLLPTASSLQHSSVLLRRPPCSSKAARSLCIECIQSSSENQEPASATPLEPAPTSLQERLRLFGRIAVPYFDQADGAKLNFGLMLVLVLVLAPVPALVIAFVPALVPVLVIVPVLVRGLVKMRVSVF